MITSDFVARVILKATGERSSATSGDSDWLTVLAIGNSYIDDWGDATDESGEPIDWLSLYTPEYSLGTVTATSSFALPSTIKKLSNAKGDIVRIDNTNGTYSEFEIVPAQQLKRYYVGNKSAPVGNYCAKIDGNLVFNRTFATTDPEFGGTIKAPVFEYPAHISGDSDVIPVDIPNWLVIMTAAEMVRNDITKQNQYGNMIKEANGLLTRMKNDNESAQVETVYRVPVARGATW